MLNWNKIWKEYRKLKIPTNLWTPEHIEMDGSEHKVIISSRSCAKTTNVVLLMCVIWKIYNHQLGEYIRLKPIAPKDLKRMFEIIKSFGYIEKLTDGEFHDYRYWGGFFYFCNFNSAGKVEKQSDAVMHVCFASTSNDLKSSYNSLAYITLIDEFMDEQIHGVNIIDVLDVLSTVGRERNEFYVFWLGNNLNGYNKILQEFGISRQVRKMTWGERKTIKVVDTRFYVELIKKSLGTEEDIKRNEVVWKRFGFAGDKASSITGAGSWNVMTYQHLPDFLNEKTDTLIETRWIYLNGDYVRLKILRNEKFGLYVYAKPSRFPPSNRNHIIYSVEELEKFNDRYCFGITKGDARVFDLIKRKCFYCTNETGAIVEEYIIESNQKLRNVHL